MARQETYLKDFRPTTLGTMRLEWGRGDLVVRATEIVGAEVGELYRVTLRLREAK